MGFFHVPMATGFNEPDHSGQANLSVSEALALWPDVVAKVPSGGRLGSPATAGNPVTGSWFPEFMAASPQMDFIAVHWYKGAKVEKFISDIQDFRGCQASLGSWVPMDPIF